MQHDPSTIKPQQKTPATLLVEQEIQRQGPMNFEVFTSLALYHPRYGYYNQNRLRSEEEAEIISPLFKSQVYFPAFLRMQFWK